MSKPIFPMPREVYQELHSGLDELDDSYGKTAEAANAREWLNDLARHWPNLIGVPDGRDIFEGKYPITGVPDAK
jgi:hypothetical protein